MTPSLPQGTQRSVIIEGRPTNGVAEVTYVAWSADESTAASLAPQRPDGGPRSSRTARGEPPKPQVAGTRISTPA